MKEFRLYCPFCNKEYNKNDVVFRCICGKPLSISYSFDVKRSVFFDSKIESMWKYYQSFPIDMEINDAITLGEGKTPLLKDAYMGSPFFVKLETVNPSGSFKDRGASLLMSYLKSHRIKAFIEDSSGNAGLSYAMYAAKGQLDAHIYVPNYLSPNRLFHLNLLNAKVHIVSGSRKDVSNAALNASKDMFYASHAWSPFFLHGIKTIAYELCEQLKVKNLPPIYVPTGNGTLLLGLFLGFKDLMDLNMIDRLPKLLAVQPKNCAPLKYFQINKTLEGFSSEYSIAEGTLIEEPPRLIEMINAIERTNGEVLEVSEERLKASFKFLNNHGYFVEPTASLAFAGFLDNPVDSGIVILTGSALKTIAIEKIT
jgi:threonine synthase